MLEIPSFHRLENSRVERRDRGRGAGGGGGAGGLDRDCDWWYRLRELCISSSNMIECVGGMRKGVCIGGGGGGGGEGGCKKAGGG